MYHTILTAGLLTLLPTLISATPVTKRQQPSTQDLTTAVNTWVSDTGTVSEFLNIAVSTSGESTFTSDAQNALAHELNELDQKSVIDSFFGTSDADINAANNELVTEGNFNDFVVGLQAIVANGATSAADISTLARGRCANILPAIDTYLAQASKQTGDGFTSFETPTAIRPICCAGFPSGSTGYC